MPTVLKRKLKLRGVKRPVQSHPAGKAWGSDWNPCPFDSRSHFQNHNAKTEQFGRKAVAASSGNAEGRI